MHAVGSRRRQLGLTLIEAMISIAIGLVVVGAVTYMYLGSKGAYRGNESLARIQEAGRFALDAVTRDIRRAGALGCGTVDSIATGSPVNVTVLPATTIAIDPTTLNLDPATNQPMSIRGFVPAAYGPNAAAPAGWAVPPGAPAYFNGDVLQVQIASGVPVRVTTKPDPTTGLMTISDNALNGGAVANFSNPNYALLANCAGATIFQVVNNPPATQLVSLQFAAAGAVAALSGQTNYGTQTFPTLQHFDQVTYYVGQVPNSTSTALYRYSLNTAQTEELVENIEDMDVVYGVDTTGAHTAANLYEHADLVTAGNNWPNVVSVRVSVIGVGDQLGAAPQPQTLLFRGPDVANPVPAPQIAPNTRLRQVFTATAALRDRIPVL